MWGCGSVSVWGCGSVSVGVWFSRCGGVVQWVSTGLGGVWVWFSGVFGRCGGVVQWVSADLGGVWV